MGKFQTIQFPHERQPVNQLKDSLIPWEYQVSGGYKVRGLRSKPSGKPVIHFLHGNGYCGLVYQQLLMPLLNDYDLFLSDIQGHGQSDKGNYFRGWNQNARYCLEVWNYFKKDWNNVPRIAMGHSLGGVLTGLMAAEDVLAFDKLILLDPVLFSPWQLRVGRIAKWTGLMSKTQLVKRTKVRKENWETPQAAYDYFFQRGMFRGWHNDCLADYVRYAMKPGPMSRNWHLSCPPDLEAAIFASFPEKLWPSLRKIKQPTWILYGDRSYPMVGKSARKLDKSAFNFKAKSLPGRHCFMLEQPKEVSAAIKKLI